MSSSCSYIQSLPIPQLERIYRRIQKSENAPSLVDDVGNLVEWLQTQPHLSHIEINQSYLISTLLLQKGLEKAKKHLDFHFTARAVHPEYFIDWDPCTTQFKNIYSSHYMVPSKVLTPDGEVVWMLGFDNLHKVATHDVFVQTTMLITFLRCHSPYKASIFIIDCKQLNSQILQAYFGGITKLRSVVLKMNSQRLSKVYVLNQFAQVAALISTVKSLPILKTKVGDRFEIWNRNLHELADVLPAECLPRDYGGSCPSIDEQKEQFHEYLSQNRDWFMTECQKKARLDVRPRTVDDEDDLFGFGVDGTFRELSVD